MKKTLLILFLITSSSLFAQSFSTGTQTLTSGLTANINIDNDTGTTTLTLAGPSNKWFGIGFGNSNMNGTDIFMTNGSYYSRCLFYIYSGEPQADSSSNESGDWTLVSNTVSSSTRTIVATRANDTGRF